MSACRSATGYYRELTVRRITNQKPAGFSVKLDPKDAAEAERVFSALAENGTVQIPLQETFWAIPFGMLVDRFGILWTINRGQTA
jgi:PhnB protein